MLLTPSLLYQIEIIINRCTRKIYDLFHFLISEKNGDKCLSGVCSQEERTNPSRDGHIAIRTKGFDQKGRINNAYL